MYIHKKKSTFLSSQNFFFFTKPVLINRVNLEKVKVRLTPKSRGDSKKYPSVNTIPQAD